MPQRRGARCRGFSLIELLVVMLIVGIIAGGASLGIDAARANDTELATEHLRRALEAAAERAEVRGRPLAVDFLGDGYRFAELGANGRWQALEEAPLFVSRQLPAALRAVALELPDQRAPAPAADATAALEPAAPGALRLVFGTRAPRFTLHLADGGRALRLVGDLSGRVERHAGNTRSGG